MVELSPRSDRSALLGVAGDTYNTAVYLKRAAPEIEVDYVTRLGDDPFSNRIMTAIAEEGIGTSAIEVQPGGTPGLYAITTTDAGERSFTYWRDQSAARGVFQTGGTPDFSVLEGYDLIYLSGISVAILPSDVRGALLAYLTDRDISFAFDSNYRPRLWEDENAACATLAAYFAAARFLLPSVDDEMALTGKSADEVTERFRALGKPGAIKCGAKGPVSLGQDVAQAYPAAPQVVDTTAAGDSFNGAYLAAVLRGQSQADALMDAHCCAVRVVQHRGAILPRETDLKG